MVLSIHGYAPDIKKMEKPATTQPIINSKRRRALSAGWYSIRSQTSLLIGFGILFFAILIALIGPLLRDTDPLKTNSDEVRSPPSLQYPFGTDKVGRDILIRVVYAIRLDLILVVVIATIATVTGGVIGLISGYVGGVPDQLLMRFTDIMMAFPGFLLAVAVTALLGNNIRTVVLALGIAYAPVAIRLVRAQALSMRESQFVEASRAIGTPSWQILLNHLLPNASPILLAQATLFLAWAMLDVAALSFLGLGIRPPTPELGSMTAEGAEYIVYGDWWISVFPGLTIMILTLAFTLIGDGLRDLFDPRQRDK
jgi:peptide/nickel transport system permease protein